MEHTCCWKYYICVTFHSLVFGTPSKLVLHGYHSFTLLNVSILYGNGIKMDN